MSIDDGYKATVNALTAAAVVFPGILRDVARKAKHESDGGSGKRPANTGTVFGRGDGDATAIRDINRSVELDAAKQQAKTANDAEVYWEQYITTRDGDGKAFTRKVTYNHVEARLREWVHMTAGGIGTTDTKLHAVSLPRPERNRLDPIMGSDDFDRKYASYLNDRLATAIDDSYWLVLDASIVMNKQGWTRRRLMLGPIESDPQVLGYTGFRDASHPDYIAQNEPIIKLFQELVRAVYLRNARKRSVHHAPSKHQDYAADAYQQDVLRVLARFRTYGLQ